MIKTYFFLLNCWRSLSIFASVDGCKCQLTGRVASILVRYINSFYSMIFRNLYKYFVVGRVSQIVRNLAIVHDFP